MAYLQAEAQRVALAPGDPALELKYTVDWEQAQLKAKNEKLALEAELAALDAKVKVFKWPESLRRKQKEACTIHQRYKMKIGSVNHGHNNLLNILTTQNEITELLIKQQKIALLPSREMCVFDGDPLQLRPFMKVVEFSVLRKTDNMLTGSVIWSNLRPDNLEI